MNRILSRSFVNAGRSLGRTPMLPLVAVQDRVPMIPQKVQVRHFGITDVVTGFMAKKAEDAKENTFKTMIDSMVNKEKWTPRDWSKILDSQLSSWMLKIPGMSNNQEKKQLEEYKAILAAFTDKELDDHTLITHKVKERVAHATDKTVYDVSLLLLNFKRTLIVQQWLQDRKKKNKSLPTNEAEFRSIQEGDDQVQRIAAKIMKEEKPRKKSPW